MQASESHLERALAEFNDRIDRLEDDPSPELVDAYVKRGRILSLMGYGIAASEDFEDAVDTLRGLEAYGTRVDPDICFRTYAVYGSSFKDSDTATMVKAYSLATKYLFSLKDALSCASLCVDCANDLVDVERIDLADPFVDAALCTRGSEDRHHLNTCLEALFLKAEWRYSAKQYREALPWLMEIIGTGISLYEEKSLDDVSLLLISYAYIADCMVNLDDNTAAVANLDALSAILEDEDIPRYVDSKSLSDIHGEVGRLYTLTGNMPLAEKHLLRQASYSLTGKDDLLSAAIRNKADAD